MATTFIESGTDATQDFTFFANTFTTNGTVTSDSTQSKDGPRSIKCDITLSGGNAQAVSQNGVLVDAGGLISVWVRFSTVAPATNTLIFSGEAINNGNTMIAVGITTAGNLRVCGRIAAGAGAVDGTTALVANTWYRISLGYVITSVSSWSATLYLNGVQEATTSQVQGNLTQVGIDNLNIGITGSSVDTFTTAAVMTVWYDSIYADNRTDKTDCGNVHVTSKRPFANGSANNFVTQIGSGGSGYGTGHAPQVNERPLSVTNGWSVVAVGATTEEYNIETSTLGDVNIGAVNLVDYLGWIYYKTVLSETPSIVINGVSSAFTSTANANTMFTKVAGSTAYPVGTGTDIGMVSDATATTVSLFECGIVFAYLLPLGSFLPILGAG